MHFAMLQILLGALVALAVAVPLFQRRDVHG